MKYKVGDYLKITSKANNGVLNKHSYIIVKIIGINNNADKIYRYRRIVSKDNYYIDNGVSIEDTDFKAGWIKVHKLTVDEVRMEML